MDEAKRLRREELGIPYHALWTDHDFRSDGYCNCGEREPANPENKSQFTGTGGVSIGNRTAGKITLDLYDDTDERSSTLREDQ